MFTLNRKLKISHAYFELLMPLDKQPKNGCAGWSDGSYLSREISSAATQWQKRVFLEPRDPWKKGLILHDE